METLQEMAARVLGAQVVVTPYDHRVPEMFDRERMHSLKCLPGGVLGRTAQLVEPLCVAPRPTSWSPTLTPRVLRPSCVNLDRELNA